MAEVGYIFPEDAAKQVVEVGKAIQTTDEKLIAYTRTAGNLITLLKEQNLSFDQLQKAQTKARETTVQLDAVGKQLEQSEQKLKQISDQRTEQIIKNRIESAKATQAIKDKIKASEAEEGSLVRMRQKLSELTKEYDKSGTRTKEAAKEIDKLSREIGKAEAATNRHQRGVGGYADQLGKLPGKFGTAANGAIGLGKQLWALVANPVGAVIAAIALAVTGLFKAFKSTDEGATAFASVLKAIGNVVDVLLDRLVSFGKMLWDIATFDFKGIKENGKEAFGGIADSLRDAAAAGWEYEQVMDAISDRESASLTRAAKLRKEIEELTVASKDRNIGTQEQIRLAELAMEKSQELNELEKGFSKERTEANLKDLASKINNDKLTNESKQNQLREWLEIDDKQLQSALEKDKAFADFYNKNEEDFKNLQKLRAADIDGETELISETRRLQTSLFTFKKELYDEEKKQRDESVKAEQKAAEDRAKAWADEVWKRAQSIENELKIQQKYEEDFEKLMDDEFKANEEKLNEQVKLSIETGEKIAEERLKLIEQEKQAEIEKEEKIKEIKQQSFDEAVGIANSLFSLKNANLQREFEMAEGNEKKQKEIAAKMAKNERNQALFSVAVDTAKAVAKSIAGSPLTFGLPFSAFAIASGALQAAAILSQKIPTFAKGTDYAPNEFIAGESGRELIKTKSGDMVMANKATYFKGDRFKGATIYTNRETEQIIKESGRSNSFIFDTTELRDELKSVKKAIINKPTYIFSKDGDIIGKQVGNYREKYINKLKYF